MVTQAFAFEFIQLLEGYWGPSWWMRKLTGVMVRKQCRRLSRLRPSCSAKSSKLSTPRSRSLPRPSGGRVTRKERWPRARRARTTCPCPNRRDPSRRRAPCSSRRTSPRRPPTPPAEPRPEPGSTEPFLSPEGRRLGGGRVDAPLAHDERKALRDISLHRRRELLPNVPEVRVQIVVAGPPQVLHQVQVGVHHEPLEPRSGEEVAQLPDRNPSWNTTVTSADSGADPAVCLGVESSRNAGRYRLRSTRLARDRAAGTAAGCRARPTTPARSAR